MDKDCLWLHTGNTASENLLRKASNVSRQFAEKRWTRFWVILWFFLVPKGSSNSLCHEFEEGCG